jgi:hypothetical protein
VRSSGFRNPQRWGFRAPFNKWSSRRWELCSSPTSPSETISGSSRLQPASPIPASLNGYHFCHTRSHGCRDATISHTGTVWCATTEIIAHGRQTGPSAALPIPSSVASASATIVFQLWMFDYLICGRYCSMNSESVQRRTDTETNETLGVRFEVSHS